MLMTTMQSELTEPARKLSISDRILLVEEIWDTIAEESEGFELSDAQKRLPRFVRTSVSSHPDSLPAGRRSVQSKFVQLLHLSWLQSRQFRHNPPLRRLKPARKNKT